VGVVVLGASVTIGCEEVDPSYNVDSAGELVWSTDTVGCAKEVGSTGPGVTVGSYKVLGLGGATPEEGAGSTGRSIVGFGKTIKVGAAGSSDALEDAVGIGAGFEGAGSGFTGGTGTGADGTGAGLEGAGSGFTGGMGAGAGLEGAGSGLTGGGTNVGTGIPGTGGITGGLHDGLLGSMVGVLPGMSHTGYPNAIVQTKPEGQGATMYRPVYPAVVAEYTHTAMPLSTQEFKENPTTQGLLLAGIDGTGDGVTIVGEGVNVGVAIAELLGITDVGGGIAEEVGGGGGGAAELELDTGGGTTVGAGEGQEPTSTAQVPTPLLSLHVVPGAQEVKT
jgi:hypothetical protein